MSLFKRRPKAPPPRKPDVYVARDARVLRFFFMEKLCPDMTREKTTGGYRVMVHPYTDEAHACFSEIREATGARVSPHQQYIAVHWHPGTVPSDAEQTIIDILSRHLGWQDPVVDYFQYSSAGHHAVERERGVRWSPSS